MNTRGACRVTGDQEAEAGIAPGHHVDNRESVWSLEVYFTGKGKAMPQRGIVTEDD